MLYYKGKKYFNVNEWVGIFNRDYVVQNIRVKARDIHQLFHHYGLKPIKTNGKREVSEKENITWFSESSVNSIRYRQDFMRTLYNIATFGDSRGMESIYQPSVKDDEEDYDTNYESNMEKYSKYLEKMYQTESTKKTIIISENAFKRLFENTFDEDVYVSSLNNKNKRANLKYSKNNGGRTYGKVIKGDFLKTDKMDKEGTDTYEVPLKGGIMSYNITSIKGVEVMHYFKQQMQKQVAKIQVDFGENHKEEYELFMENPEFELFKKQFLHKISLIVDWKLKEYNLEQDEEILKLSILPVPSSSNFNYTMAQAIKNDLVCGLPINVVNKDFIKKDISNLNKDEEFIKQNKDYYNSNFIKGGGENFNYSVIDRVDSDINKMKSSQEMQPLVDEVNTCVDYLLRFYYNRQKYTDEQIFPKVKTLIDNYLKSVAKMKSYKVKYLDLTRNTVSKNNDAQPIIKPYTKGESVRQRTEYFINILKNNLKNYINIEKKLLENPIQYWEIPNFQIKNLSNPSRLALKNYFSFNKNEKMIEDEVNKMNEGAVIIFDDNISGGATLSDICMQLKNIGVKNIIPITFGEMSQKWSMGILQINKPENGKFNNV